MEATRNVSHISQVVKFTDAKHNKDIKQLNFFTCSVPKKCFVMLVFSPSGPIQYCTWLSDVYNFIL